jgi:hypothetical protein
MAHRERKWRFENAANRVVDFKRECLRCYFAARFVPFSRFGELFIRFGMKPQSSHRRRKSFALTSSQGMVSTAPDSISRHLRSASAAQSSSTSGSGGGSKLSMSNPASVARSFSGRLKASRKTSFRSRPIATFYRVEMSKMTRKSGVSPEVADLDVKVLLECSFRRRREFRYGIIICSKTGQLKRRAIRTSPTVPALPTAMV